MITGSLRRTTADAAIRFLTLRSAVARTAKL